MAFSVLVAALALSAASCASVAAERVHTQTAPLELTVAYGASARVPDSDITITFESIQTDSRCPTGVTCIWAGDAAVVVAVQTGGAPVTRYTLHTDVGTREVMHDTRRIGVVTLLPHPKSDDTTKREDHRLTLSIGLP